jgi:hypothetical protein
MTTPPVRGGLPDRRPTAISPAVAGYRPRHEMRPHRPVFVDRTGRRRRVLVLVGISGAVGVLSAAVGLLLAITGTGGGAVPNLPGSTARAQAAASPHPTSADHAPTRRPAPSAGSTPGGAASTAPAVNPSPSPAPPTTPATTPSPTVNPHRHVPTQTPSRGKK